MLNAALERLATLPGLSGLVGPTARRGVLAVGDRLVVAGTNFATLIVVGRAAGVEELGTFALAWTVLLASNVLAEALVVTPYTVLAVRLPSAVARARHAASALLFTLVLGGLGTVACLVVALLVRDEAWGLAILCLAIALPASGLREFARRFLFARLMALNALVLDGAAALLQLFLLAGLWAGGWLSPATALLAIALGTGLPALAWTLAARRAFRLPGRAFAFDRLRGHLSFARWLGAAQLADLAVAHGMVWWVATFSGIAATGIFAAGNSVVMVLNPLVLGIGSVLLPRAALAQHRRGRNEVARIVWKVTALLAAASLAVGTTLAIVGGPLVGLLYGFDATAAVALTVALLAFAAVLGATAFPADNGLMVIGRQDVNFAASLAGLVGTFAAALFLVPALGVVGAALAVALGTAANAALQLAAFARLAGRPRRRGLGAFA